MKPSHFVSEDLDGDKEREDVESEQEDIDIVESDNEGSSHSDSVASMDEGEAMDVDTLLANLGNNPTATVTESVTPSTAAATLKLQTGFQWTNELVEDNGASSSDDDEENEQRKKKKRKHKKQIEQDLTADMHTKVPESTADFERHLLASPNSSYLWIQYMSFQLQLAEVEKAREIGRRALQAINIREEQEKLNVWIALLNLENTYGTDDSLAMLFKDAARHNDSKTIHLRLAAIFDQSQKLEVNTQRPISRSTLV